MASIVTRTRDFTAEVMDELKKVTWPDWPQLQNSTFIILIFCVIVAAIIALMDWFARGALDVIMSLFAG